MKFSIQASNPRTLIPPKEHEYLHDCDFYEVLGSLIYDSFPLYAEEAVLCWNGERIHLGYEDHFDRMIPDMVAVIRELRRSPEGSSEVCFGIQGFMPTWEYQWRNGVITPAWREHYEFARRRDDIPPVTLRLRHFIAEWKRPMQNCLKAILEAGFKEMYPQILTEFQDLIQSIPGAGFLYELEGSPPGYIELDFDHIIADDIRIRTEGRTVEILECSTPDLINELKQAAIALKHGISHLRFRSRPEHLWEMESMAGGAEAIRIRITEMRKEGDRVLLDFKTTRTQWCGEIDEVARFYDETH